LRTASHVHADEGYLRLVEETALAKARPSNVLLDRSGQYPPEARIPEADERQADLDLVKSESFRDFLSKHGFVRVSWSDLAKARVVQR